VYFPYFKYGCSLEINTARTAAYLQNRCDICTVPILGTMDLREDCAILGYEIDETDGVTIVPVTYTTPAGDDAPWIDASHPESARFMGFVIDSVTKPSHIGRAVTTRISGSGGGVLETTRPAAQQFDFEVILFACDSTSMEYGFRYLMTSLAGGGCEDPCTLCEMEYRDTCPTWVAATPTLEEFNVGRWILKNVGVTKAPEWSDPPVTGMGYYARRVKFSLASELPWKFECPEVCVDSATFPTPTVEACGASFETFFCVPTYASCAVIEPSIVGETGFIIDIKAGKTKPLSNVLIKIIPDENGWVSNPGSAPSGFVEPDPCDLVYVEDIPKNHTLSYDTSIEKVYMTSNAGVVEDGTPYLSFDGVGGPPTYPIVRCGQFCVKVEVDECSVSTGAKLTIQTVHREY
jgi:hypothetical protein